MSSGINAILYLGTIIKNIKARKKVTPYMMDINNKILLSIPMANKNSCEIEQEPMISFMSGNLTPTIKFKIVKSRKSIVNIRSFLTCFPLLFLSYLIQYCSKIQLFCQDNFSFCLFWKKINFEIFH